MINRTDGVGRWARRLVSAAVSGAARAATGSTLAVTPDPGPAGVGSTQAAKRSVTKRPAVKKSAATTTSSNQATGAAKTAVAGLKKSAATPKRAAAKRAASAVKATRVTRASSAAKASMAAKVTSPARPSRAKPAGAKAAMPAAAKPAAVKPAAVKPAAVKPAVTRGSVGKAAPTKAVSDKAAPRSLQVREDETPWTAAELREVRTELEHDVARLTSEIEMAETGLHELLRDSGEGTGDDQADAGAKTFEREQEIALANNSREMLVQSNRALTAIDDGTYGVCESCALPVGKMRLQAFPRATLCVSCKQRQERR